MDMKYLYFNFIERPQVPPRNVILKPELIYEEIDHDDFQDRPTKKDDAIDIRNTITQWYDEASDEIERDLSLGIKPILKLRKADLAPRCVLITSFLIR